VELFCPSCGDDLANAPLRLGDRWCDYCGTCSSPRACLRALPRAVRLASPLAEPPPKVVILQDGDAFRLELSRNNEDESALFWVLIVVYAFVAGGLLLSGGLGRIWLFPAVFVSVLVVLSAVAALRTWGRDILLVDAQSLAICQGLGRWRRGERHIQRSRLRSVELVRLPNALGRYGDRPGFAIRFVLDDGAQVDFGLGHGYSQLSHAARWLRETVKLT